MVERAACTTETRRYSSRNLLTIHHTLTMHSHLNKRTRDRPLQVPGTQQSTITRQLLDNYYYSTLHSTIGQYSRPIQSHASLLIGSFVLQERTRTTLESPRVTQCSTFSMFNASNMQHAMFTLALTLPQQVPHHATYDVLLQCTYGA